MDFLNNMFATTIKDIIPILPNTMIDDFFFFGFLGGIVGYAYYIFATRDLDGHLKNKGRFWITLYGILISGLLGGLLAIVFDRSIELAILVGLTHQIIYMTLIKGVAKGEFWTAIKEVIVKLLTGGIKS